MTDSNATGVMVVGAEGRMGLEIRAALASEPSLLSLIHI